MARVSNNKEYWTSPDGIAVISQWKRNGLTNEEVAKKLEIHIATLYRWVEDSANLREALKLNKEIANTTLENKAFQMALEGNTAMMIFLLKNRMSDRYVEKQVSDVNLNSETMEEMKLLAKKVLDETE